MKKLLSLIFILLLVLLLPRMVLASETTMPDSETGTGTVTGVTGGTGLTSTGGTTPSLSHDAHTSEVTGSTALTVIDDIIDEANLKIEDGAPTNGDFLVADSTKDGGLKWSALTSLDISLPEGEILIGNGSGLADNASMDALTVDIATTGSLSGQAEFTTDAAGAITITVNAVNYGTDANLGHDADIPDGACDAAADVGNWVVLISKLKNQYSLTSDDATNIFILADNETLTAGDELDVDGSMVSVMCIAAEYWKVLGYIDVAPTDGGPAD